MSERHIGPSGPKAEANFALRMRLLREARGMSQAEIATRVTRMGIAIPQQTIARIETGKRSLRLDEATAIAHALGANLLDMLQDPVEVTDPRTQLREATEQLEAAREDRHNAEQSLKAYDISRGVAADELDMAREQEARLQAIVEQLHAAVAELDKGGEQ